jgi:hypothetical protein
MEMFSSKFDIVAERTYWWSLIFQVFFFVVFTVLEHFGQITDNYIKGLAILNKTFLVFTIPVSLRVIGKDILPELSNMITAYRFGKKKEEK